MTIHESLWSFAMLGTLLIVLWVFRRVRRRTRGYFEARVFKERLPQWVSTFELLVWAIFLLLIGGATLEGFWIAHHAVIAGEHIRGATTVFSVMGAGLIAMPLAGLAANAVSWFLPPVRAANLHAMHGLHASFAEMNRGLFLFGCVSVPVGALMLLVAIFEPWAH